MDRTADTSVDVTAPVGGDADISPIVLCAVDYDRARSTSADVRGYRKVRLGAIEVQHYAGSGLHCGHRTAQHIAADHGDDYLVSIPLQVHVEFAQSGECGAVEPGDFVLLSTSMPFAASIRGLRGQDGFSGLNIRISGRALRQRLPVADLCCGHTIRTRAGAGVIMQRMCELMLAEGRNLSEAEAEQFGTMLIDAVVTATSESPEILSRSRLAPRRAQIRIWKQAMRYIDEQLTHPGLDTEAVAQHCRVSKRYLQAVFAEMDGTVCGVIREARLQRCRSALRDPALQQQSVAQIALHWGFNDLPNFCRSYKARFDCSPGRDRAPAIAAKQRLVA